MMAARAHSASHLLDVAMRKSGRNDLKPSKGSHDYKTNMYVEYEGEVDANDRDALAKRLNVEIQKLLDVDYDVQVFPKATKDEVIKLCGSFPSYLSDEKPVRVVKMSDEDACPCGGTHVKKISTIGKIQVTAVKKGSKNIVRVSYTI